MTVRYPYVAAVHQSGERQILSRGALPEGLDADDALIDWWIGELIESGKIEKADVKNWSVFVVREPAFNEHASWPNEDQATAFFGVEPRPRQGFQSPDPQPLNYRVERGDEMLTVVLSAEERRVTVTHHKAGRRITSLHLSECSAVYLPGLQTPAFMDISFNGAAGHAVIQVRSTFQITVEA